MENQHPAGEAQNSQKKIWYQQPKKLWLCIIGAIILFALLVRNSEDLFITLMLISLGCFLISWLFPNIFYKLFRKESKALVRTVFGLATVVFFVVFGVISDKNKPDSLKEISQQENQQEQKPVIAETKNEDNNQSHQTTTPEAQNNTPAPTKTDQQLLEENIANAVSSIGGSDMSYRSLGIEKSDPDRPKDTQMITVSIDIKSFWSKDSLIRKTSKLSSSIFQAIYNAPSMKAYDVIVWYYSETTDRYGSKKDDVVLSYAIDKATYEKINWQNFDQATLCDFLEQEAKITGRIDNTACNVLANIN